MLSLINPAIFPDNLLKVIAHHFKNPKASSDTDFRLFMELSSFDEITNKTHIFELAEGSLFSIPDGRKFIIGKRRVKRFVCEEVSTQRKYVFSPHAEVTLVEK
jgi:SprT protein